MIEGGDCFYVYVHSRLKNGEPFYVGKGNGRRHVVGRRNRHWHNIVNKDGGFYTSIVAREIDEELALLLEVEVIDKYRRGGARLTNMTDGGEGASGMKLSAETRAKIGAAARGNKHAVGYKHTPEARARIATAAAIAKKGNKDWLGKRHSEETKAKLSAARMGNTHSSSPEARAKISAVNTGNKYCLGFKHSAEARANMSAAHRGPRGPMSEQTRANISAALRASWKRRKGGY